MSSPNPAQLEMRILANHGADKRFAFLRGRWARTWKTAKGRIRVEKEEKRKKEEQDKRRIGLGGLSGYGDSDEESDNQSVGKTIDDRGQLKSKLLATKERVVVTSGSTSTLTNSTVDNDALMKARRARAREWAEKRRAKAKGPFNHLCLLGYNSSIYPLLFC